MVSELTMGVISITTRNGGGKLTVNFSSTAFLTAKPDADHLNLLNSWQMVDMQQELFNLGAPLMTTHQTRSPTQNRGSVL